METYTTDCIHYQICSPTCTHMCQFYEKARPHGEWISDSNNLPICKECGEIAICMVKSNFCPNRGASMKGGADMRGEKK